MKKNLLFLFAFTFLLINSGIRAQSLLRQKSFGGNKEEDFSAMQLTRDGGLVIAGASQSGISGNKTSATRGGAFDYWVVKLSKQGNIEWNTNIGGRKYDYAQFIQQTKDGGYIVGGVSSSDISGDKTQLPYANSNDYWIVKLDANGSVQWDKTIGGNDYDWLYFVYQTPDGGFILTGTSFSNISGNKTANSKGSGDIWMVKTDSLGTMQWDKTIGSSDNDEIYAMTPTPDGGYLLGSTSPGNASGDKTENSRGGSDYWIIKTDAQGNVQWDRTIGGSNTEGLYAVLPAADGGYLLGGASLSDASGEKTANSFGNFDYWLVKTDAQGHVKWDKDYGGNNNDYLTSMDYAAGGGYVLSGHSSSDTTGNKSEVSRGSYDYWVIKTDSAGAVVWDKTIGGNDADYVGSIKAQKNGNYVVGGTSYSGVSGDKTSPLYGVADYWLVLLNSKGQMIGTENEKTNMLISSLPANSSGFTAYPNPAKGEIHIQTNDKAVYTLTSVSGAVMLTQTIAGNGRLDVSKLTRGVYYLTNLSTGKKQTILLVE